MDKLTDLLFRGLIIGFSIAAPVGPIGVLCIRRTLAEGTVAGFVSGLGAATADAFYGCVAGFGLTIVSGLLVQQQFWFRLLGGLFLCYLGVKTFLIRPVQASADEKKRSLLRAFALTFFLTLTNPVTILSFAAIFAGLGLARTGQTYASAVVMVAGVFFGSALWWFALSGGVSIFRKRFSLTTLHWVNWISGTVITGFGVVALFSAR